jgi:hypothetical protein
MKSITKIGGITVATLLTVTIVSMSLMESADAVRPNNRQETNQQSRQDCRADDVLIGACVGGVNADVDANIQCSVAVFASQCSEER